MNSNWILFSLTPLCALTLLAQAPQAPAPRKLARVPAQELRPEDKARTPDAQVEDWKQKLTDADLDRRESAFSDLVQRAREDRDLRAALEQWSSAKDAPELSWTARLALRELRTGGSARARGLGGPPRPGDGFDELRQRFDTLERQFGGLDSMFEDLHSQFGANPLLQRQPQGMTQQSQSYTLQMGPDGVTLETTENADGNGQKKTYKAKSMEELLQNYPELRGRIAHAGPLEGLGSPDSKWYFPQDGLPDNGWLRSPRPSQQPPTEVLGIYSQKLTAEQAKELDLEPEQGLRVERVEPGTIAQILGIRRGDTIVELDGQPIYSAEDVRRILKERKPDFDLTVKLLGEGSKTPRTLRWSPAEPQPSPAPQPDNAPGQAGGPPRKL